MKLKFFYYILTPICFLLIWLLISELSLVPQVLVPSPIKIFSYLFSNFYPLLIKPTIFTIWLWLLGFIVGAIVGIAIGLVVGYSNKIYNFFEILIDFFRSLPAIVLLPIAVIFLGIGYAPKLFIVIFSTALYVMINTIYGVRYGKTSKALLAKVLRMTPLQEFKKIILPSSLPNIFAGLRITISLSLVVAVASEMIVSGTSGLGQKILDDMIIYNLTEMYSIILVIGLLGYFSNKIFSVVENKLIHWKGY